jgi:hypothetical protein
VPTPVGRWRLRPRTRRNALELDAHAFSTLIIGRRKVMSLIFGIVLGAASIDDCDLLRAGRTRRLLGGWVAAPSTLGRSCARSRSGTCASSTGCWPRR